MPTVEADLALDKYQYLHNSVIDACPVLTLFAGFVFNFSKIFWDCALVASEDDIFAIARQRIECNPG